MTGACRDLRSSLARPSGEPLPAAAAVHLAACTACRDHAAANERLVEALRVEPDPVDDITRSRWLARMSPELDAIAADRAHPRRSHRPVWLAAAAAAALLALVVGWWWSRGSDGSVVAAELPAVDRALLRPYVTTGPSDDHTATNLLANKLSTLAVGAGQLVRASFEHDRDQRVAVVGPARVEVTAATAGEVELALAGTLLVDARSDAAVRVVAGDVVIRAQHATFAVQAATEGPIVFVDRGELTVGAREVKAGDWYGPTSSAALVQLLRDHANALAPPARGTGILAVDGTRTILTRRGAILGTAPLWARVDPGELEIVLAGAQERRATVIVDDKLVRVADGEASADPAKTSTSAPRPGDPAAAESSKARRPGDPTSDASTNARLGDAASTNARPGEPTSDASTSARRPGDSATTDARRPTPANDDATRPRDPAAELYARAEAALGGGDPASAARLWRELVEAYPSSRHAAHALYDLARVARTSDPAAAQRYLGRLLAGSPPAALREPAHYLSCRLHVDTGALDAAASCFTAFRAAFPSSSHDAEVLAWLAGRAEAAGSCARSAEYLKAYPNGPFAARARACKGTP